MSSRSRRIWAAPLVWLALVAPAAGCLYDEGDVCGPNQHVGERGGCECDENAVLVAGEPGCVACAEGEVASPDGCVCADGFARSEATGECQPLPAGLGAACDTGSLPCTDAEFDHCQPTSGTTGYCTSSGCATSDECPPDHACVVDSAPSYCKRPPVGQGAPCQGPEDCADYEATYCETFVAHVCLVEDCTAEPNSCHEGWQCCDLSSYGVDETLCVEAGTCPT